VATGGVPVNPKTERVFFECTKCGACCRENTLLVTVTGRDIARLSNGLGFYSNEVIRALDFYLVSGEQPPKGLQDIPSVKTENGLAYIALKKLENGDCVFLKDDLCMIHPIRPGVCMSFPFVFRSDKTEITWGLSAKKEICPGLGVGPEVKLEDLSELAATVLEDLSMFKGFAEEWNRTEQKPTATRLIEVIISDPRFST
jgi:Fe-S-cluster containining protein